LVTRSGTKVPFICSGCGTNNTPGPLLVPPLSSERSKADYGEGSERPDLPFFTLSQGPCPGGMFPEGGALFLVVGEGKVAIESEGRGLPVWDYRCDEPPENYPPLGRLELRVGYFQGIPVMDYVDNGKVTLEIKAPPQVRAGAELHYRIRTRVSGNVFLGVLGCPGYTQRIEGVAEERHRLNCEGLYDTAERRLLADQWFDMVLDIPQRQAGPADPDLGTGPPLPGGAGFGEIGDHVAVSDDLRVRLRARGARSGLCRIIESDVSDALYASCEREVKVP
jgi:hypothetical protein